jgi:hypothetical protein
MQQQNVKEFDNKSRRKTKGKMFRNSMLGSIITYWIHGGSRHGVLRLDLHQKNLETYFMQIIRLKSNINYKTVALRAIHVTREGGKLIYALSFHLLRGYTFVFSILI